MRAGPDAPRIIGRYAVYGEIASGGMASVHFGRLLGPDESARTVAVKRAHPHLAREADFALMFLDEARLASRIHHANVVETIEVLAVPPELLLVMEYVHGESLWRLMRGARDEGVRMPPEVAAATVVDMLRGLHAAHEATDERGGPLGIVHRDVSPQNILVGIDGVSRLVDFGIAKAAGRLHSTRDSSVKGKYAYMAPEQVRGEAVSRVTDTYAAGIVLWEMLTGERLFVGKNEAETIHKCLVGRVYPPSRFVPELGSHVDDVLRKALSRDPAGRYATAESMSADIEACFPSPVDRAVIGGWVQRLAGDALRERARRLAEIEEHELHTRRSRRRRVMAAVALALGAAAAIGSVAIVAERRSASATEGPASSAAQSLPLQDPIASTGSPSPPALAVVVVPTAATPIESAEPTVASAPRPSESPPPRATRAGSAARSTRAKAAACDPPYSVDSQGRKLFKPECM